MKILVRLPNWVGDMIMSAAFIEQLSNAYPGCEISVVVKKELDDLLEFFPFIKNKYSFSKKEFSGLRGAYRFGKKIVDKDFDIFFILPDSFSSALMAYATGAKKRVGYKKEFRALLLTNTYNKKQGHRVEQYLDLLRLYAKKDIEQTNILLRSTVKQKDKIIVNINSEASSRRLPKEKAVSIIEHVRKNTDEEIILIGSSREKKFVDEVFNSLNNKQNIYNTAGETSLHQLADLLASAKIMLSTDSGPAHLANALGVYTIVLFGAGDEKETAPFNKQNRTIIRLGQLSCEPCRDNVCKRYGIPKCLTGLSEELITNEVIKHLN